MCFSSQCKISSLSGMLLHLAEGLAQLTAQYWFSYNQVSITLSKPHKVKGFRCGLLVSPCILSAHNMLHLCIPACTTSKKEWLLPHYCVKNWIILAASGKKKVKQTHKKKRTLLCSLAFVSRVVDVFFCGGVRMYVTQALSIFSAMSFFCLFPFFFLARSHTHAHTHRGMYPEVLLVWCRGVQVRLMNLQLFVLKADPWIMVRGRAREEQEKNGVHHIKAGGWVDSKRFSCLMSSGRQSN